MIFKHKLLIIFQLITLCCFTPNISYSKENNSLILTKKNLSSFGFRTTKNNKYNTLCGSYEKTKPEQVNYQSIKSIKAVKGTSHTYYRFTLIKEVYTDAATALSSLEKVKNTKGNSWYSKTCGIKKGVQIKNKLYFLATDVGVFRSKLTPVLNKIIDQLKDL